MSTINYETQFHVTVFKQIHKQYYYFITCECTYNKAGVYQLRYAKYCIHGRRKRIKRVVGGKNLISIWHPLK